MPLTLFTEYMLMLFQRDSDSNGRRMLSEMFGCGVPDNYLPLFALIAFQVTGDVGKHHFFLESLFYLKSRKQA